MDDDQNALTAEEQALLDGDAANTETDAGLVDANKPAETSATPKADAPAGSDAEGEKDAKTGSDKEAKHVPLAALQESRAEIKRLKDEAKAEKEARLLLEQRTNLILERLTPKPEEPKPEVIPDFETDPAGWIAGTMRATGKTLEQIQGELAARKTKDAEAERQQANTNAVNDIISKAAAQEVEFKKTAPDYDDAGAFLLQSRIDELKEIGYDDKQIMGIVSNEKLAIAQKALADGKNPAAVVYAMAKRRGYAPKKADAAPDPAKLATEKIAALGKGQEQAQSLSGTRGQGPSPLTAARLLEMSEADFAKFMDTPEGRAAMGA